jgi:hypothetical protein
MLKSFEGFYRHGRFELSETLPSDLEGKVIVTFVNGDVVDLVQRGINEQHAGELSHRLKAFAEDWERPEMDVYDAL